MKLLIVSATIFEIEDVVNKYFQKTTTIGLYKSDVFKNTDIYITGVGMLAMAVNLNTFLIKSDTEYDTVINVGFCGCYNNKLNTGELVFVNSDCIVEFGVLNNNIGKINNEFNFNCNNSYLLEKIKTLKAVRGATVNCNTNNRAKANYYTKKYKAETESMEGASFYDVCEKQKQQCLQIRSVSNHIPWKSKEEWDFNIAKKSLTKFLLEICYYSVTPTNYE